MPNTRLAQLLVSLAMFSAAVYAQPSLIVNAYYGDSNGSTPLSALISSGATKHLTHITYAFATSNNTSNPCTGAPTAMNLTDLQNLRAQNPNIKILISVGGADQYGVFVNAMPNATAINNFANACVNTLLGSYPGYIDGIDIDWEFPQNTTDERNFNLLLGDFRTALLGYAQTHQLSESFLLTAAIGPESTPFGWQYVDFNGATCAPAANNSVDFYNIEFYNYAYNNDGVTESNAPIHSINDDIYGNPNAYGAAGLIPVGGVPANKIVLGIPFYGDHYTGVTSGANLGSPGTLDSPSSATGTPTYAQIAAMIAANPAAFQSNSNTDGSAWSWKSSTGDFYEYDNTATIAQKLNYAKSNHLGGIFIWNIAQDTSTGTLLNSIVTSATPGLILKSPDGTKCVRITIDESGVIVKTSLTCP